MSLPIYRLFICCLFSFTTDLLQMPKAKLEDLFLFVVLSKGQSAKIWAGSKNYINLEILISQLQLQ